MFKQLFNLAAWVLAASWLFLILPWGLSSMTLVLVEFLSLCQPVTTH